MCVETLHSALCKTLVLKLLSFSKPLVVEPDASELAVGAVLLHKYADGVHSIIYYSKKYLAVE